MKNTVYGWSGTVQRRGEEGYGTDQSSLIAKMIHVPGIALLPRDQGSTQSSNPLNTLPKLSGNQNHQGTLKKHKFHSPTTQRV